MKRPLRILASLTSLSTLMGSQTLFFPEPVYSQAFVGDRCPPGTSIRRGQNLIRNGNFATPPGVLGPLTGGVGGVPLNNNAQFSSDLPYVGDGVYPSDGSVAFPLPLPPFTGGISIQTGSIGSPLTPVEVKGEPFPGDPINDVPRSQTYLYSNPNSTTTGDPPFSSPVIWRQEVSGLSPNTTYNFFAYFYDLLTFAVPSPPAVVTPQIRLRINPNLPNDPGLSAGVAPTVAERQQWRPIQFAFTTGSAQTVVVLEFQDTANNINGDDFGVTAIGLRECVPNIGVAKSVGTPIDNGNGTFTIPYTVRVRNLAPVPLPVQPVTTYDLRNLQLTDPLTDLAAKATINSITNIQSPTLAVNIAYSGSASPNLLLGTDTLRPQTTGVVSFNVILTPGTGPEGFGPYTNMVKATALSQGGSPVPKDSTDGGDPDPSGTNTETASTPTVVRIGGVANILLVKRVTNVTRNGSSLGGVNFGGFVDDPATPEDNNPGWTQLQPTAAPVGIIALDINSPVIPGDEVEYTVYFLSNGAVPAPAVNVCDLIPPGTTLVSGSSQIRLNNTPPVSGGTVFTPLAPLPPNNSCSNQSNPNGAVIFNLSDLPNTPAGNVGFVRFRVRIN